MTTLPGLIISVISIVVMWALVAGKRKVEHELNSSSILADANRTLVCISICRSSRYCPAWFTMGAIGLIYFSCNDGKDAFEKAAGMECSCEDDSPE